MIHFLTTVLFCLGVGYHVMQIVMKLRKQFPQFGFGQIFSTFFNQEWDSLLRSLLVLLTLQMALVITHFANVALPQWLEGWGLYCISLVLGYAGQRIAYKYLGTAADVLEKKAGGGNN